MGSFTVTIYQIITVLFLAQACTIKMAFPFPFCQLVIFLFKCCTNNSEKKRSKYTLLQPINYQAQGKVRVRLCYRLCETNFQLTKQTNHRPVKYTCANQPLALCSFYCLEFANTSNNVDVDVDINACKIKNLPISVEAWPLLTLRQRSARCPVFRELPLFQSPGVGISEIAHTVYYII